MKKEGNTTLQKLLSLPALFTIALVLIVVLLILSISFSNRRPSVQNGASVSEVQDYAYQLLAEDDGTSAVGYNKALDYYNSQIASAISSEQEFNLKLDLATFLGRTGDPASGIQTIGDINAEVLPLNARYYLYATYIYLYGRQSDEDSVAYYRQKIADEGIDEYFAALDDGAIEPAFFPDDIYSVTSTEYNNVDADADADTEDDAEDDADTEDDAESAQFEGDEGL